MVPPGFVYIAYPVNSTRVKIGYSRTNERKFKARYSTFYGSDFKYHIFYHNDPSYLEKSTHKEFTQYRITNELFDIAYIEDYKAFLNRHCNDPHQDQINNSETIELSTQSAPSENQDDQPQPIVNDHTVVNNYMKTPLSHDSCVDKWMCKRCGVEFTQKSSLKTHLQTKKIHCNPTLEDISIEVLLQEFEKTYNDVTYDCTLCEKRFNTRQSMYRHRKMCARKREAISKITEQNNQPVQIDNLEMNVLKKQMDVLQDIVNCLILEKMKRTY